MVFTNNQVQQFYVGTGVASGSHVVDAENAGTIKAIAVPGKKQLYLEQKGAVDIQTTDLIDAEHILSAKAVKASTMARKLNAYKITLNSAVNSGAIVVNEVYGLIANITAPNTQLSLYKDAHVLGRAGMSASDFYKAMALQFALNISTDPVKMLKVYVETGGTSASAVGTLVEVTAATAASSLSSTYTGIVIEEVEQSWRIGVKASAPVQFEIVTDLITVLGVEEAWATVAKVDAGHPAITMVNLLLTLNGTAWVTELTNTDNLIILTQLTLNILLTQVKFMTLLKFILHLLVQMMLFKSQKDN